VPVKQVNCISIDDTILKKFPYFRVELIFQNIKLLKGINW
jgi:hypothetical protein